MFTVLVNGKPDGLPYRSERAAKREAAKYERLSPTSRAIVRAA